jgi:hypothetical protein
VNTLDIFLEISYFAILLPLVVTIGYWHQLVGPYRYLAVYVLIAFVLEAILYCTSTFLHVNNLWVVHIYVPVQFLFLSTVYYQVLSDKNVRVFILVMSGLVLAVSVLESLVVGSLMLFNTYTLASTCAMLILYSLLYLEKVFRELKVKRLEQDPMFLLSAGSLLYFSGTILGDVFMNTLIAESATVTDIIQFINRFLNVIFRICVALALWHAARPRAEESIRVADAGGAAMQRH